MPNLSDLKLAGIPDMLVILILRAILIALRIQIIPRRAKGMFMLSL
jgi:hypothetical protein